MLNELTDERFIPNSKGVKKLNRFRRIYFLVLLLLLPACAYRPKIIAENISPQQIASVKEPTCLIGEEKLLYGISWLGIPAGRMNLEVKDIEKINGRDYYRLVCNAGPNNFFSFFFKSKYILETYVDVESALPLKSSRKRLPKGEIDEIITFDRNNKIAQINDGKAVKEIALTQNSHDLLSFLYYFRVHGLESGKKYDFDIVYGGKSWPVEMTTQGFCQLRLRDGKRIRVIAVKLSSALILEIMGNKDLEAYVSADLKRIPVFFTVKTKMGKADTTLISELDF
ncbi:MAG: DUF3108 domain-containing protein [Candidatus Omnitrophota bacterium]|jgi:hypothetical protein